MLGRGAVHGVRCRGGPAVCECKSDPSPVLPKMQRVVLLPLLLAAVAAQDFTGFSEQEKTALKLVAAGVVKDAVLSADTDASGGVTPAELSAAASRWQFPVSEAVMQNLTAPLDEDGDGALGPAEVAADIATLSQAAFTRLATWVAVQVVMGKNAVSFPLFHYDATLADVTALVGDDVPPEAGPLLAAAFAVLDVNGNSVLEIDEGVAPLEAAVAACVAAATGPAALLAVASADLDASRGLSLQEFTSAVAAHGLSDPAVIASVHGKADVDGDGEVSVGEGMGAVEGVAAAARALLLKARELMAARREYKSREEWTAVPSEGAWVKQGKSYPPAPASVSVDVAADAEVVWEEGEYDEVEDAQPASP